MPSYIKHTINCRCTLPHLKNKDNNLHSFVVFSIVDDEGNIEPSYSQCNNCRLIHKITEIGESQILNKEDMPSLLTADEIKQSIPESILKAIEPYTKIDGMENEAEQLLFLPTLQEIKFIIENEKWGTPVVLFKEKMDDKIIGKYILLLGQSLFKIENFSMDEYVELK